MRRTLHRASIVALLVVLSACSSNPPPTLTPRGALVYQLNDVVIAVGTVQTAAIELNKVKACPQPTCGPLFSDANTRIVVEVVTDLLTTLRGVPAGAKGIVIAALDRLEARLDAAGHDRLLVYVTAARTVALGLIGA